VWSLQILDFRVRIYPTDLSSEQLKLCNKFTCKVSDLPPNTTAHDLHEIIIQNKVKSYFIPRSHSSYHLLNFAFLHFAIAKDVEQVINKCQIKLNNRTLYWSLALHSHCYKCKYPDHKTKECSLTPLNHVGIILNFMIGLDLLNIGHDIKHQIHLPIILVLLNDKVSQTMALLLTDSPKISKILVLRIMFILNKSMIM